MMAAPYMPQAAR
jgi:hypothetical protein